MTDLVPIKRALISLSDKSGLEKLAAGLARHGVEFVSTGGTAARLRELGHAVRDISDVTGFPEIMDGRVKTLHPKVHGGLLGVRDNPDHRAVMDQHGIEDIDLVVVNLYPFEQTVARGADRDTIIENIDIGGPSMIRSAAKNHAHVAVVTEPDDYEPLLAEMDGNGGATTLDLRKRLAATAYARTAAYDSMISQWFAFADQQQRFPQTWVQANSLKIPLRYGENPHQRAALYIPDGPHAEGIAQAEQVQGKELSYNNLNDANAALELAAEFRDGPPAIVIVKHANPCGVARAETLVEAWRAALACDSVSAFGGIVAANRTLDGATAEAIAQIFTEVVVAPDADADARAVFGKKKNLRLLLTGALPDPNRGGSDIGGHCRRAPRPGPRQRPCLPRTTQMRDQAPADGGGNRRLPVRLDRRQARQVQRHRLRQGWRHRGHWRRPDESPRFSAHRRRQGSRSGRNQRLASTAHDRLGGRVRRFFPVRRRLARRSRGWGDRDYPARRLDPRRRSDRRC